MEGYQGLRELAESSDEVWNMARNQEIAGGLSNRALVRSREETAGTPPLPLESLQPFSPSLAQGARSWREHLVAPIWIPCPPLVAAGA